MRRDEIGEPSWKFALALPSLHDSQSGVNVVFAKEVLFFVCLVGRC